MMEQTAVDLGYSQFEPTLTILRMANQEKVIPCGKLSKIPIRISDMDFQINVVILRLTVQSNFPILLGRPWLYKAGVVEDWKHKEFRIGGV